MSFNEFVRASKHSAFLALGASLLFCVADDNLRHSAKTHYRGDAVNAVLCGA
jgi:hypothetical protein